MNRGRQQAIDYLCAPANGLWHWTENGTVLVWHDGKTIAFREEIAHILEWLAPGGLPSLGAIVFLLAACRGMVPSAGDIVTESDATLPPSMRGTLVLTARRQLKLQLEAALAQLTKVFQLPDELKTGLKARCVLAEAVFEAARAERQVEARSVLRGLREPIGEADLREAADARGHGNYIRQIHMVAEGLKLHTAESLALRMRTGLDALPNEIDATLPVCERARRLIEELSRDRDLGAVARAARDLTAAVRLPRRLGEREQLALGGVADITNRGPLDRLLLSELAHDDLTLSVRVALNEALYLRREPPMREPPGTLAILLDSGVRLWGIPRVLATAVALALVARGKQHGEVLTWRAHGKSLSPVDLLSRTGLTQHLGVLETTAHAGESLASFEQAVSPCAQNQSIVITHRDALDDAGFRRALAAHPAAPGFVAVVDRQGHFELHAWPAGRRPPLCEADLDLASIFDDKTGVGPIRREVDPSLPAIFGVQPFPFLLPIAGRVGLSGFDEESTLRVDYLIQPPRARADDWNCAQAGVPSLPELRAVLLAQPPSIEDIFGDAQEDIGTELPEDLPPAPDEPKEDKVAKARRNLRRLLARGVASAARQFPHTSPRRTWLNDVEDWANRQLRGVNDQLEKLRHKELHRLLSLLATDPEAGLRHAIPMNDFAHRGIAPPSARLGLRSPSFDPARLGGGPADFWDAPSDLQALLRQRYREMADREMQLGRYRRAAYIYAELLGDLLSAANALKQGQHFREAALLYDEHLKDPLGAAQCLDQGGLLLEAIERYEKLERWLDVADLHERLGNGVAAEQALRRVIAERLVLDDILGAAKLLDERLHATDEALELLLRAWPASRQAARCIGAMFQMLARLGRHELASERLTMTGYPHGSH